MNATIKEGHVLDVLADMPEESVHCVVTSPPYWGLRDYGKCTRALWDAYLKDGRRHDPWHGQLGLEPTIDMYVEHIVEVFRAVRRALRKDGTLWINVGDSYGAQQGEGFNSGKRVDKASRSLGRANPIGPKNLIGQPWRIAFALQADGWILRSDIIWAKPNPMPESVTDRPTKSHEHVFLFAKSQRYFWDAEAVREADSGKQRPTRRFGAKVQEGTNRKDIGNMFADTGGRNLRDVWNIPTEAVKSAHFATFPHRLAERCIKAGTSERGCCPECGAPWERVVEMTAEYRQLLESGTAWRDASGKIGMVNRQNKGHPSSVPAKNHTTGWEPGCKCLSDDVVLHSGVPDDGERVPFDPVPCTVLDPFTGSGQAGIAATQLGRAFIGIEINPKYAAMARQRIANPEPLPDPVDVPGQMEFFA